MIFVPGLRLLGSLLNGLRRLNYGPACIKNGSALAVHLKIMTVHFSVDLAPLDSAIRFSLTIVVIHFGVGWRRRWASMNLDEQFWAVLEYLEDAGDSPYAHVHARHLRFCCKQERARLQIIQQSLDVTQEGQSRMRVVFLLMRWGCRGALGLK